MLLVSEHTGHPALSFREFSPLYYLLDSLNSSKICNSTKTVNLQKYLDDQYIPLQASAHSCLDSLQ